VPDKFQASTAFSGSRGVTPRPAPRSFNEEGACRGEARQSEEGSASAGCYP
jgi:hypothetical protein